MEKREGRKNVLLVTLGFFLMLVFFINIGAAETSFSETEFNIAGCTFQFNDLFVGVSIGSCSVGEEYGGLFFCNEDRGGYITTEEGLGCSRGLSTFTPGTPEGACCPNDRPYCAEAANGLFQCQERLSNCYANMTKDQCESLQVDGYYYEGECICTRSEQSCDIYESEGDCDSDIMNIGSVGIGRSEYCGGYLFCGDTTFSIPANSCGCSWNDGANGGDGSCEHSISAVDFSAEVSAEFECSSSYDLGECVDGFRDVNWTSTRNIIEGSVPDECFDILGCNDGSDILTCGDNFVKLPGFSLFSLFMSLFVIGIYYFVSGMFKHKRRHIL